jgi:putative Holliday junction resolvase
VTGRVVAFDLGDRRIGVAVSDPTATLADGGETIERSGDSVPWRAILARLEETEAVAAVVGDPVNMDGSSGERSRLAHAFAEELGRRAGIAVHLLDERLTTVEAERRLIETRAGRGKRKRKGRVEDLDRVAATILLQAWLDGRAGREARAAREAREREDGAA